MPGPGAPGPLRELGVPAVRVVARGELRRAWAGLLALAVLVGLAGGVVLGAVALAERTVTAYPRLADATLLDDVRVAVPADQPALAAALPRLDGVVAAAGTDLWVGQVEGERTAFVSLGAPAGEPVTGVPAIRPPTPVVVAGKAPEAVDEVLVSEAYFASAGLRLGDTVVLRLLTLADFADFAVGFEPHGPRVPLRVTGVGRMTDWNGFVHLLGTPALAVRLGGTALMTMQHLRTAPGRAAVVAEAADRTAEQVSAVQPTKAAQYLQPALRPRDTVAPSVRAAEGSLLAGLVLFAGVVAIGVVQVAWIGLSRFARGGAPARAVERQLGLTPAQTVTARVLAAAPFALLAGLIAALTVLAAGRLAPLGGQARFEPAPGYRLPWAPALLGAPLLVALLLALTAVTVVVAGRPGSRRALRAEAPVTAAALATAGAWRSARRWPAVLLGSRLAARTGTVRQGPPVLLAVLGAASAVAAIVAALAVGASLDRLVATPARWAGSADFTLVDARVPDVRDLAADARVAALTLVESGQLRLADGRFLGVGALTDVKGAPPVELTAGRLPATPDEIAVSPRIMTRLGIGIGDELSVLTRTPAWGPELPGAEPAPGPGPAPTWAARPMRVVGVGVVPSHASDSLGEDVLATRAGLLATAQRKPIVVAQVHAAPGQADTLFDELATDLEVVPGGPPDPVVTLGELRRLPELLAAVLAVVAGTGFAHWLLATGRRLRREMAVFTALGATRGQLRATLATVAVATVVPALALGVALGVGGARVAWWELASAVGVAGDLAVPWTQVALLVVATLAGSVLVVTVPLALAARLPPAAALAAP